MLRQIKKIAFFLKLGTVGITAFLFLTHRKLAALRRQEAKRQNAKQNAMALQKVSFFEEFRKNLNWQEKERFKQSAIEPKVKEAKEMIN